MAAGGNHIAIRGRRGRLARRINCHINAARCGAILMMPTCQQKSVLPSAGRGETKPQNLQPSPFQADFKRPTNIAEEAQCNSTTNRTNAPKQYTTQAPMAALMGQSNEDIHARLRLLRRHFMGYERTNQKLVHGWPSPQKISRFRGASQCSHIYSLPCPSNIAQLSQYAIPNPPSRGQLAPQQQDFFKLSQNAVPDAPSRGQLAPQPQDLFFCGETQKPQL